MLVDLWHATLHNRSAALDTDISTYSENRAGENSKHKTKKCPYCTVLPLFFSMVLSSELTCSTSVLQMKL
jgi:hypothetical protein